MENSVLVSPLKTVHVNVTVNPSTATRTEIVPASAGARYRVLSVALSGTLAQTSVFESATTAISAVFPTAAGVPLVLPFNQHGWFETAVGAALNISTSVATATGVQIQYIKLAS
jgi:hypothetical protein